MVVGLCATVVAKRKRRGLRLLAIFAAISVVALPAWAMRVSPMVVEMETRGSDAVARIEVQNINPGNLAFQTRVFRMTIDDDGKMIETPADDQFLIFPPQGVLPGGEIGRESCRERVGQYV